MYCVRCGVRLQEGVACCPLCQTPVWNPDQKEAARSDDPAELFRDLAGEAATWRDYLLAADSGGTAFLCRYARREQCRFCRFAGLCPAEHVL